MPPYTHNGFSVGISLSYITRTSTGIAYVILSLNSSLDSDSFWWILF